MTLFITIIIITAIWIGVIYYLGSAGFGRDSTQLMIDRAFMRWPMLWGFVNSIHGHLRAGWHYVEFGALTLILYLLISWIDHGSFSRDWSPAAAWLSLLLSSIYAYIDEWHQARTPGRQFRRIDFLHSLHGSALIFLVILMYCNIRIFQQ